MNVLSWAVETDGEEKKVEGLQEKNKGPKVWESIRRGEDILDDTAMFVILLYSNYTFIISFLVKSVPPSPLNFSAYTHV